MRQFHTVKIFLQLSERVSSKDFILDSKTTQDTR
jgi:hypothetical protein